MESMTYDLRLNRKAVRDILSRFPEGANKDELARSAAEKGIAGDDFEKALANLLNSGRAFYDKSGKIHQVRNE